MVLTLTGAFFLLFGCFIIFSNYIRQIKNYKDQNKEHASYSSPAPFAGPIFVIVGYSVLPLEFSNLIFFVIALDPDTLIILLSLPYFFKGLKK